MTLPAGNFITFRGGEFVFDPALVQLYNHSTVATTRHAPSGQHFWQYGHLPPTSPIEDVAVILCCDEVVAFPRPKGRGPIGRRATTQARRLSVLPLVRECVNIYVNAMPHVFFVWNDELIEYLGQHGVTQDEFEEVVLNSREVEVSRSSGRPIVFGPTSTGKYLACVFEYVDKDTIVPVTAYEVD